MGAIGDEERGRDCLYYGRSRSNNALWDVDD
jgi:hypothetical protein